MCPPNSRGRSPQTHHPGWPTRRGRGPSCADAIAVYCRAMAIGGVLFDIDGVLVTSWKPIPGAAETVRALSDNQIACSYLTNTTTRTRVQIAELLTEAGTAVRPDEVITA